MHITEQKQQLRQSMRERLDHLPDQAKQAESRSLCRALLPHIAKGSTVCAYYPLTTEPDIRPLLEELLLRGDAVFLPRFVANHFEYRQVFHLSDLAPGALNIPEPAADATILVPTTTTVVLVPGRAFDRVGHRLGRGAGGYDIWIATQREVNPATTFIGVTYECQVVATVPHEPHDQMMDAIATAREFITIR